MNGVTESEAFKTKESQALQTIPPASTKEANKPVVDRIRALGSKAAETLEEEAKEIEKEYKKIIEGLLKQADLEREHADKAAKAIETYLEGLSTRADSLTSK